MIVKGFETFKMLLLIIADNNFKKNQNLSEFTILISSIASHSHVFHEAKIKLDLPFVLLLIIYQLWPTGSHEYCCLDERLKINFSQLMIISHYQSEKVTQYRIMLS